MSGSLIVYSCLTYRVTQEIKPSEKVQKLCISIIPKKWLKNHINPCYSYNLRPTCLREPQKYKI